MTLPIVLREQAEREFDEAFDWYESRRVGLGALFAGNIQKAFDEIILRPLNHPQIHADIRKKVVRRFPYCIFFRLHDDRIEVIAVFHTSRDPSIWQART